MAIRVTLDDIIAETQPEILALLQKDFRKELDTRITILDLSYEALKVNVYRNTKQHIKAYDYAYQVLVNAVEKISKRKYSSLEDMPVGYFTKKNAGYVYIDGGNSNRFIVANSFGAIDTFIREVSRDKDVAKTSFGVSNILRVKKDKNGRVIPDDYTKEQRRKVDIGHIASADSENLTSPLEEKIQAVLRLGKETGNSKVAIAAERALKDLYSIQASASYSFKNTTPEAIATAQRVLGVGYVVVTLHRQKLNNRFSSEESAVFFKLKQSIAKAVASRPYEILAGSNNIVQDISQYLLHTLDPKAKSKPKSHSRRSPKTTKKQVVLAGPKTKSTSRKVSLTDIPPESLPSLTSLQVLLDATLVQRVKQNMGSGNSRTVLNLRSGRLAESAKVERLTESRAGMITAFYSYMKNPYATFSDGGRQQNPRSRDPKLLISKSIREIAAQQVANRLRAVAI
jgi:hypothetical protein